MSVITRRALLGGAVAAGIAGAGTRVAGAAGNPVGAAVGRVRVTREEHRAIVIGSGFGGGVTALRLAQAGVPVLVLERGLRWPTGPNSETFPRADAGRLRRQR